MFDILYVHQSLGCMIGSWFILSVG